MRYTYLSGFENYKRSQQTYIRSTASRRIFFHFQMWGSLCLGIAFLVFVSVTDLRTHIPVPIFAGVIGGLVGGGVVAPLLRPWQIRKVYKACNGPINTPLQVYLEIQDGVLVSGIEGKSEGRFQRSSICNVVEDNAIMLLFMAKKRFLYLPKAALPAQALNEIRAWLQLPGAPETC